MDYEKYNNALEKAKARYNEIKDTNCSEKEFLLELFPELKKSEDERIRKDIMILVKDWWNRVNKDNISTKEQMIAWLEKQKEIDKEIVFRPLAGTDIITAARQALEKIEIGKEVVLAFNGAYIPVNGKTVAEICNGYFSWSEKQNKNNSENGNLKETISLNSYEKQDEQDFSHNVDDEIRNELYDFIYITTFQPKDLKKKERFLDWLEKQGNNSNQTWKPSKEQINALEHFVRSIGESGYASPYDDNTNRIKSLLNDLCKLKKQGEKKVSSVDFKAKDWYVSNVDGKIHNVNISSEKQGEKKSTDKVEPKFKVGDWIVDNRTGVLHYIAKIKGTVDGCYYVLGHDKGLLHIDNENDYHLWTIQDAKDGDVLVNGSNIFIFHFINGTRLMGHCHVNTDDGRFYDDIGKNECFCLIDGIVNLATKEECDLLFKKMKEKGYEWDAEKKVLIDKNGEQDSKEEIKTTAYGTFGKYGVVEYVYILDYNSGRVIVAKHDVQETIENLFKKLGLKESQCHYMVSSDVLSIEYINF